MFNDFDEIRIENLDVFCVVGIYPHEKIEPQSVVVDLSLFVDTRRAAAHSSLEFTVDYAALSVELRFILEHSHFRLLETAADALAHYLLATPAPGRPRGFIAGVELRLKKPKALSGPAVASLKIQRRVEEITVKSTTLSVGTVDIIHENSDCGIYRLILPPSAETPVFFHEAGEVSDLAISSGLLAQGGAFPIGTACSWPQSIPRYFGNPTTQVKAILCVTRPPGLLSKLSVTASSASELLPIRREWKKKYLP